MGYNGNNRKGPKSSMFKKSAYKSGSNMLFGKNGIFTDIFNITTDVVKDLNNYTPDIDELDSNKKLDGCGIAIMLIIALPLFILGIYWIQLPYGYAILNDLGILFIILSVFCIIAAVIGLSKSSSLPPKSHEQLECNTYSDKNQQNIINTEYLSDRNSLSNNECSIPDEKEESVAGKQTIFIGYISNQLNKETQHHIIDYYIKNNYSTVIKDCVGDNYIVKYITNFSSAISLLNTKHSFLIIPQTNIFRTTTEVLNLIEKVGNEKIYFCDLPNNNKETIVTYFLIEERIHIIRQISTKNGLNTRKKEIETNGYFISKSGNKRTKLGGNGVISDNAINASAESRRNKALTNEYNLAFFEFITDYQLIHGKITANTDFSPIAEELNKRGKRTSTGLDFNSKRARSMYYNTKELFTNQNKLLHTNTKG